MAGEADLEELRRRDVFATAFFVFLAAARGTVVRVLPDLRAGRFRDTAVFRERFLRDDEPRIKECRDLKRPSRKGIPESG
ncbi:MAG: hypothetical protein ACLFPX_03370 [Candidatus Omnitrophota bacterium]